MTGRTCKLRCIWWDGEMPRVGHFLQARRGRTAYEITAIRKTGERTAVFTVCRWEPAEVPEGAVRHLWFWSKR